RPRETLYSPPPSQTRNWRAVRTRPSPGSSRSITSPRETQSNVQESAERRERAMSRGLGKGNRLAGQLGDAGEVTGGEWGHHPASATGHDRGQGEIIAKIGRCDAARRNEF